MSDEKVDISVEVITKGQESLKQVNNDLAALEKKVTNAATSTGKHEVAQHKSNKALSAQIPVLKNLQPLLGAAGLGFLGGATAIAAIGAGAMMANQSFETWMATMLGFAVSTNTLTGSTDSFVESLYGVNKSAADLIIPEQDYAKAMEILNGVTRNTSTSLGILTDAVKIHKETGIPLVDVVNDLAGAFTGTKEVYDEFGNRIPAGVTALNVLEKQLMATKNEQGKLRTATEDDFRVMTENIGQGVGSAVNALKIASMNVALLGWELLGIGEDGWLVRGIGNMIMFFRDIDWDAIWKNIGASWSNVWRGTVNVGINAINWIIEQMNKLHWDIPSWVPLLGGKTFGFNITPIPLLAKGGDILSGGSAIVGENGPELLNLPTGAQVSPLGSGGSGPIQINIHIGDEKIGEWFIQNLDRSVRLRGAY
ncbi:MAG: hypothetical protein A9183_03075 [Dehalococcoides mccartyi]|uniref:hypothetical protein n=1 Tax=Dehalococcoides mccartyi TaxID=61435 RepID=UPI000806064A|nr:hypothetical protein [Dehalococcoides mccartyi]OBW61101.1 MAG: hypothetical protein A9183_03075 [Dehalococcoides mccartyi]